MPAPSSAARIVARAMGRKETGSVARVLLIEDETSISEPLAFLLRGSGFEVTVIDNGVDAIRAFNRSVVDLILLDLQLPGVPGMHLCRQLRQRSRAPNIMLTARDTEADTVAGPDAGADDYVTKPFASGELIARMRAVLRRRQPPEPTPSSVLGNTLVRMNLYAHQITVERSPMSLPLRSFQWLEGLMCSPGQVRTRGELIDQVWVLTRRSRARPWIPRSPGCGKCSSSILPTRNTCAPCAVSATPTIPRRTCPWRRTVHRTVTWGPPGGHLPLSSLCPTSQRRCGQLSPAR